MRGHLADSPVHQPIFSGAIRRIRNGAISINSCYQQRGTAKRRAITCSTVLAVMFQK